MNDLAATPLTPLTPSDPRWELTQRVAQSSYFRKGPKLRAFLLHVCENALLGRTENLTAQLIGSKVFGRSPQYDLGEDTIVRVEARELRKRLEAYFAAEGRDEPIVIEIPKGSYAPVFRPRAAAPVVSEAEEPGKPAVPREPGRPVEHARAWLVPVLAITALSAIAGVLWLAVENVRLRQYAPAASSAELGIYPDLLGTMAAVPNRETLMVLSNPNVLMYYSSETEIPASTPLTFRAPAELKPTLGFLMRPSDVNFPYQYISVVREDYTGMGEAVAAFRLAQLMQNLRRPVRLTQSRFLNWDHVQKQDLVLLGGPSSNDWSYQNDSKSSFSIVRDKVEIAKPLAGEQERYAREGGFTAGTARTEYGVIKMLVSPYGFKTLLFAGVTSAGTAGVGEFFSTPKAMADVHQRIRSAVGSGTAFPAEWEVLVRIMVRDGLPVKTAAVTVRPAPGASSQAR